MRAEKRWDCAEEPKKGGNPEDSKSAVSRASLVFKIFTRYCKLPAPPGWVPLSTPSS